MLQWGGVSGQSNGANNTNNNANNTQHRNNTNSNNKRPGNNGNTKSLQNTQKKAKVTIKTMTKTVTKLTSVTQTPEFSSRSIGTQTDPEFVEKVIIPKKYQGKASETVAENETEEPQNVGVNLNDAEDILANLGKYLISSDKKVIVAKLLGALFNLLTPVENQGDKEQYILRLLSKG